MLGHFSNALPYILLHLPFWPTMKPFAHMSIFIPLTFSVAIKNLAKNLLVVLPRFAYLLQRQQKAINFTLYDYQFKINSQSHTPDFSEVFTLVSGQSGAKRYALSSSRTKVSLSCHFVLPWVLFRIIINLLNFKIVHRSTAMYVCHIPKFCHKYCMSERVSFGLEVRESFPLAFTLFPKSVTGKKTRGMNKNRTMQEKMLLRNYAFNGSGFSIRK